MAIMNVGWCQRCESAYEAPAKAHLRMRRRPPVSYDGRPQPNFHPDKSAYLRLVRALPYVPTAADLARLIDRLRCR